MHALAKVFIGIILLVVPLGLYAYEYLYHVNPTFIGLEFNFLGSLWIILQGMIPPMLMVLGLFIIWLELDEWKIEKELKTEEKKEKKKEKKK